MLHLYSQVLFKSELDKQLWQGLIAGKHPQVLARDIRKVFNVSRSDAERLMRTELARVQTDAQMRSFEENGFEWYMFLSLGSRACEVCRALNGKKFKVKDMLVGENAPPMHPNCRCSTAAAMGDEEIAEIRGGENTGSRYTNYAKAIDNVSVNDSFGTPGFTKEELLNEAQKTSVGRNVIKALENEEVGVVISSNFDPFEPDARGRQDGNVLYLFAPNIISVKGAAKTMIHEYTHYRYNIGNCQHAEAICFAYEKMHNENRAFLYDDEWEYVKGLAIYAYPAYNWEQGGYGDYEQFDFVRSRNKKG